MTRNTRRSSAKLSANDVYNDKGGGRETAVRLASGAVSNEHKI